MEKKFFTIGKELVDFDRRGAVVLNDVLAIALKHRMNLLEIGYEEKNYKPNSKYLQKLIKYVIAEKTLPDKYALIGKGGEEIIIQGKIMKLRLDENSKKIFNNIIIKILTEKRPIHGIIFRHKKREERLDYYQWGMPDETHTCPWLFLNVGGQINGAGDADLLADIKQKLKKTSKDFYSISFGDDKQWTCFSSKKYYKGRDRKRKGSPKFDFGVGAIPKLKPFGKLMLKAWNALLDSAIEHKLDMFEVEYKGTNSPKLTKYLALLRKHSVMEIGRPTTFAATYIREKLVSPQHTLQVVVMKGELNYDSRKILGMQELMSLLKEGVVIEVYLRVKHHTENLEYSWLWGSKPEIMPRWTVSHIELHRLAFGGLADPKMLSTICNTLKKANKKLSITSPSLET